MIMALCKSICLSGAVGGVLLGSVSAPFAEWVIHRDVMHVIPPKRKGRSSFVKKSSEAHHDEHHKAFSVPAHYYRDLTNAHCISTFNNKHVASIGLGSASVALAVSSGPAYLFDLLPSTQGSFVLGFTTAALGYYAIYELVHDRMHDIGQQRLLVGNILGDMIQGGQRDGKLRLSKPLLDELCDAYQPLLKTLPSSSSASVPTISSIAPKFSSSTIKELGSQLEMNRQKGEAVVAIEPGEEHKILDEVATELLLRPQSTKHLPAEPTSLLRRSALAWTDKMIRGTQWFQFLDRHHFVHHVAFWKNLNVVWPLADRMLNTLQDSSACTLSDPKCFKRSWLCPNPPPSPPFAQPRKHRGPLPE
jgi:hypothetical protein